MQTVAVRAGDTTRNLIRGGVPALLSSVVTALVPALGAFFLSDDSYAVWALAATLTTIFLLVDFGTTALATKLAAERALARRSLTSLVLLTAAPPVVLTATALLVWPAYAAAAGLQRAGEPVVVVLIAAVGVGTALRSVGLVGASVALGRRQFGRRSVILLGGALVQATSTILALLAGWDLLALGAGVGVSGAYQAVAALALARPDAEAVQHARAWPLIRRFASVRGVAVVLGVTVTQMDRWSLGLFAGATVLTAYDLAIRFATMPKIALLAFGSGLITEASGPEGRQRWRPLFDRYTRLFALLALAGTVGAAVTSVLFVQERTDLALGAVVALTVVATLSHGVHAVTIPAYFLTMGVGRPELELLYLTPLALLCACAYVLGNATGSPTLQLAVWGGALCLVPLAYVIGFKPLLSRSLARA